MILSKLSERFGIAKRKLEALKNKVLKIIVRAESKYWIPRVAEQEADFTRDAETCARMLAEPIQRAADEFCEQARKIYGNFQSAFKLSDSEAKRLLKDASPDMSMIDSLKKIADSLPDGDEKRKIQAEISAPAYRYRIEQAEKTLKEQNEILDDLARHEIKTDTRFFRKEVQKAVENEAANEAGAAKAVKEAVSDALNVPEKVVGSAVDKALNSGMNFTATDRVNKILNTDWSGRHFSQRVWGNTDKLAGELRNVMLHMELTGDSYQKLTAMVQERFGVRGYEARRLLRTETNYIINQVELDRMKERGIEEYEIDAVLDERTSDICQHENGKVYKVAEAVVGVNYPPFHPFCRSRAYRHFSEEKAAETTDDIFENMSYDDLDKWLKENNMTWDEWVDRQVSGKDDDSTLNSAVESAEENSLNMLTSVENGDRINGRGSGTFDYPVYSAEDCWSEQLGRIDITDSRQIAKTLGDFENNYRGSSVEHCIVISKNGDVYVVHGGPINIHPEILGEDVMRGSINEHNHIPEATQHSFGKDDFINSSTDGTSMALACDEKYRYYMRFSREYTDMEASHAYKNATDSVDNDCKFHPDRVPEGDEQHERIKRACEELGIEYGRNEIS